MPAASQKWLDAAFPPALAASVREAISENPQYTDLFQRIAGHISTLHPPADAPSPKKRKLTASATPASSTRATPAASPELLRLDGLSFSVPVRKKLNFVLTATSLAAVAPTGKPEYTLALDDVEYAALLPVPDKAARQLNLCIIPKGGSGLGGATRDALVFTIPEAEPKLAAAPPEGADASSYRSLLIGVLNPLLAASRASVSAIEEPAQEVFFSAVAQSHRKGEKAFHVKAHRGSKEGYLFFLRRGVLWGFKKPLLHFGFADIRSISYTSITKRTFDLAIAVSGEDAEQSVEFSMIDQEEYPGIDEYIKTHRLNDESFAEMRKAKRYGVNGKVDGEGGDAGELEKALEEAQEEEEEEDEDYAPPGEGGEGEAGSGSESGSDDDDESEGEDGDDPEENMSDGEGSVDLKDELGSEMEDVEVDQPKQKRAKRVRA